MPFRNSDKYDFWDTDWREVGAVYGIFGRDGRLIYVGQTENLKERMGDYRSDTSHCMHRRDPHRVTMELISSEALRLTRERQLIDELDPPCNKT